MRKLQVQWNKATLGLVTMGSVVVAELIVVAIIAGLGQPIPPELWDVVRLTVVSLAGVAGAQALNGRVKE